jgi:tight adherence protein B
VLAYGTIDVLAAERNQLSGALKFYQDDLDTPDATTLAKLADSEIVRKAMAGTTKIAQDRGVLEKIEAGLAQADLPLKPAEAIFFSVIATIAAMTIGAVTFSIVGLVVAGALVGYSPIAVVKFLGHRRRARFTTQLPVMLDMLAGTLRAGYSLVQGIEAISREVPMPMSTELQRAMNEERLGRPIVEALQEVAERMRSVDFEWVVMAIKIQHEVGGNLAELLGTVGDTMVQRERLRREVRSLTAEGRLSAIILVALPPVIGGIVWAMNPTYMEPLINNSFGQMVLGGGVVMIVFGWFVMQKMIDIKV